MDTERIKKLAKQQGKSVTYICKLIDRPAYYLNDIAKRDDRMISDQDLHTIAINLETTVEYLKGETDNPHFKVESIGMKTFPAEKKNARPIVGHASAGLGVIAEQEILGYARVEDEFDNDNFFWLQVAGDSMAPVINNDDLVLVQKDSPLEANTVMVVVVDDDNGYVKKVYIDDDTITLHSYNPEYRPMVFGGSEIKRLRFIGKVRELKRVF